MRVEIDDDIGARAALLVRDSVDDAASRLLDAVRAKAPGGRVWITAHDERVRPTHVDADGQLIPTNLRFVLERPGTTGVEQGRRPRDPDLSDANRINCRCVDVDIPGVIAASMRRTDVEVIGARASAQVYTEFPRAAESEFPSQGDGGGGWMRRALDEVALTYRGVAR